MACRGRLWSHGPAHLQAFNTFIDDVIAFIITMPTSHRLACFRDDVVFPGCALPAVVSVAPVPLPGEVGRWALGARPVPALLSV